MPLLDFAVAEAPFRSPPEGQTTLYRLEEAAGLDAFYAFLDIFNLASLGEGDYGLWRCWLAGIKGGRCEPVFINHHVQ